MFTRYDLLLARWAEGRKKIAAVIARLAPPPPTRTHAQRRLFSKMLNWPAATAAVGGGSSGLRSLAPAGFSVNGNSRTQHNNNNTQRNTQAWDDELKAGNKYTQLLLASFPQTFVFSRKVVRTN